jgi:ribosomal protein S12 methylthiotransferase
MEDNVPEAVKIQRADAVMALQSGISYTLNQQKIGKSFKTMFDRVEGDYFVGRTEFDSPEVDNEVRVHKNADTYIPLGHFANVTITEADAFDLYGEITS